MHGLVLLRVRFFCVCLCICIVCCVIVIASSFKSRDVNEKEERVTPVHVFEKRSPLSLGLFASGRGGGKVEKITLAGCDKV